MSLYFFLTCLGAIFVMIFKMVYKGTNEYPVAIGFLVLYAGVVTAFNLVYLIVNELFPTIFLATAYGFCNIVGRGIEILAPLVANEPDPIPMMVLAVFSAICVLLPFGLIKYNKKN